MRGEALGKVKLQPCNMTTLPTVSLINANKRGGGNIFGEEVNCGCQTFKDSRDLKLKRNVERYFYLYYKQ